MGVRELVSELWQLKGGHVLDKISYYCLQSRARILNFDFEIWSVTFFVFMLIIFLPTAVYNWLFIIELLQIMCFFKMAHRWRHRVVTSPKKLADLSSVNIYHWSKFQVIWSFSFPENLRTKSVKMNELLTAYKHKINTRIGFVTLRRIQVFLWPNY